MRGRTIQIFPFLLWTETLDVITSSAPEMQEKTNTFDPWSLARAIPRPAIHSYGKGDRETPAHSVETGSARQNEQNRAKISKSHESPRMRIREIQTSSNQLVIHRDERARMQP